MAINLQSFKLQLFDAESDNQGVNGDGFGEGGNEQHRHQDLAGGFRVAADRFHGLRADPTDTESRDNRADADRQGFRKHDIFHNFFMSRNLNKSIEAPATIYYYLN